MAVSINLQRIITYPDLPSRAVSALILFSLPLVLGIWLLIPGQATATLGSELLATGLLAGIALIWLSRPALRTEHEPWLSWLLGRRLPSVAIPILVAVAGATLIAETGGGLYWMPAAVLLALFAGLTTAWVLLVEILR